MNYLKCKSCGEIYIPHYLHCCKHRDCLVRRMSLNYGFSVKGHIQKTFLLDEVNQKSTSSNSAFYNSNNKAASASETSDASTLSRTYEANRNIVPRNDVQFFRPWLMGNVKPGFHCLSQNEGYTIPSMSQRFGLLRRPVCITPIRNDSQMRSEYTSNNDKESERPANIQKNEILRSKYKEPKRRETNQNKEDKASFPSTSRKPSDNPLDYDSAVAGPSRPRHVGHICPVCRKEFPKQSKLKRHSVVHSKEKPFVCDVCQKSYSQKGTLNRHMRLHSRKKLYTSRYCGKAFHLKHALKVHIRIHTGEKPFKCELCDKAFSQLGHLQRHVLIHKSGKSTS